MQMVSEVMTRDVVFVSPQESLQRAAQMMDDLNVGVLPVCDGERLVGMVTDRDITVRGTSVGQAPGQTCVEDVMSGDVRWCFEDQPLEEVMQQMADSQIRRVPVVSHDELHSLIGIVALGDLATRTADEEQKQEVEQVVEKVSSPSEPDRPQQPVAANASGGDEKTAAGASAAGGDKGSAPRPSAAAASGPGMRVAGSDVDDAATVTGAPEKGTSAGPGSTGSIGAAAGTGLGAPASGAGGAPGAGGIGTAGGTGAPARGTADAAGGPSAPASGAAGAAGTATPPAGAAGTTAGKDTAGTGAPGGTDAAGATGATGGTAGTTGAAGKDTGARP